MVVLASTTGWDDSARMLIEGRGRGTAFSHPSILVYLFDLERNDQVYNPEDESARRYAELFIPLLPEEELEEVTHAVEKELLFHESLTLVYAAEKLPYSEKLLQQAFNKMAATGRYNLTQVEGLGTAILRQ